MTRPSALIVGVAGHEVTDEEARLIEAVQPFGFILFKRNCDRAGQVRALVARLKSLVAHDPPVLIDQEGGRVSRLPAPRWPRFPAPGMLSMVAEAGIGTFEDAVYWHARLTGEVLRNINVTVNCAPMLDIPVPGSDDTVLGDRTYGDSASIVESAGLHAVRGLREAGIVPVIKHLPGHGRAKVDSHKSLPRIDEPLEVLRDSDFRPFSMVSAFYGDRVLGMTGHLLLSAIDDKPVSLSPKLIGEVIRQEIGFTGHLMADDITMGALSGTLVERAAGAIEAGCDSVLYCAPDPAPWSELADAVGEMGESGWQGWLSAASANSSAGTPMDAEMFLSEHRRWLTPALIAMSNRQQVVDPTNG
jgi:beta-N-acetylhexosaminidase